MAKVSLLGPVFVLFQQTLLSTHIPLSLRGAKRYIFRVMNGVWIWVLECPPGCEWGPLWGRKIREKGADGSLQVLSAQALQTLGGTCSSGPLMVGAQYIYVMFHFSISLFKPGDSSLGMSQLKCIDVIYLSKSTFMKQTAKLQCPPPFGAITRVL